MLNRLKEATLPANTRQYREETADRISWGHWFALFNIILAILIASRYAFNADWPNTLSGKLYFFISLLLLKHCCFYFGRSDLIFISSLMECSSIFFVSLFFNYYGFHFI